MKVFRGNSEKIKKFLFFPAFFSLISTTFTRELVLKIEVVERVKNLNLDVVKFILDGVNIELANAFRRMHSDRSSIYGHYSSLVY